MFANPAFNSSPVPAYALRTRDLQGNYEVAIRAGHCAARVARPLDEAEQAIREALNFISSRTSRLETV